MRLAPFVCLATLAFAPSAWALKVACAGSSSMAGNGSSEGHHIADELATALGADFTVENFAVAATTAIKALPNAWASTPQYSDALASNPDVVLFWFGGNDSWADVWPDHGDEFKADYQSIVEEFQALPSHPKTFLIRLWVFQDGPAQLDVLDQEIIPMIEEIGTATNSTVIDYRTFITPHPEWFDDGMHANDTGTAAIGPFFAEQITAALAANNNGGAAGAGGTGEMAGAGGAAVAGGTAGTATGGASGSTGLVAPTAGAAGAAMFPASGGAGGTPSTAGAAGSAGTSGSAGSAGTATSGNPPATVNESGSSCGITQSPGNVSMAFWLLSIVVAIRRRRAS